MIIIHRELHDSTRPAELFSVRDMLMPAALLERTNWRDNPLVAYSQRRSRRPGRIVLIRLMEIVLLFWCYMLLPLHSFTYGYQNIHIQFATPKIDNNIFYGFPFYATIPIILGLPVLMLLRYHLLINDQSHHIKTLSPEGLSELLLTQLGREEFFLHHLLLFCRRYRVLIAFIVIAAICWLMEYPDGIRMSSAIYQMILGMLNIVMLTWIAGVLQYAMEWKWFAGGRARPWRPFLSLIYSMILACPITFLSSWVMGNLLLYGLTVCLLTWVAAVCFTHRKGLAVYLHSERQLRTRLGYTFPGL